MFKIGEFSKLSKTTIKTLRYYDEIGLFKPSYVEDNGYRFYSIDDLEKIALIRQLREFGVSVNDVKTALDSNDLQSVLCAQKTGLRCQIEDMNRRLLQIDDFIEKMEKGDTMKKYQAIEKQIPSYNVYYRHGTIDSMKDLFTFVLDAEAEATKNNPDLKCENYCFITYEAPEYQENNVELEYVEAVEKFGKESKNIKFKTIDAIDALTVEHRGAYKNLGDAYAYAVGYAKERGYKIAGKIREVYIHGCWDSENEDDYLTEIQIPVQK